ncbi:glycosyltransferase family 4 protein [Vibrio cholerae]|uniref:glycosyltransferase family 4 protein n=1 Tax=Vibrio cholerae TaxID=666 RepID=UPI00028D9942|nr:glycosyltransferase family 4 protein [Vibrio cholerae]EKG59736.1 glycosyl transferases group 1 family protein [Vibrio cholerae HC-52A1]EKG64946.1 glycosyl transferases group 1 family protein [Vibrio cholerae HC-56A1]EKG65222.1 glycosyl transferases group 1 family protein [Vibrio cholerae HC-55A1]EKG74276.1 glycosyl transferases group 1 family protein [Vibrio cholerae HC-57A1]EKG94386.1 glycosyl transferases group 1 family protein [Vibrio cholerae HC-51A1]
MKLIMVANTAWSVFNFRHSLIKELLRCGVQLYVIAPEDKFSAKLTEMGCQVLDLPMQAKGVNPIADLGLMLRLLRHYREIKPDFIIHYTIKPNIYGSLAAKLAGIPSLAITTGLGYTFVNQNVVSQVARQLYKFAFCYPQEVWFLNEDDRRAFLEHHLIEPDKAVLLHGEGVNLNHFVPTDKPQPDGNVRFLLIARMLRDKGVCEFVEAARQIRQHYPNAIFQLLGDCSVPNPSVIRREEIALWEKEGVVEYLGTTDDVRPIIAQADCLVLPSYYREGIPRTLMEGAAMAKPIITTDNVGCRDVVLDSQTGYLCEVKNAKSLAQRCEQFLTLSDSEKQAMGKAGRSFMEAKFDEKWVIKQYFATLKKYEVLSVKNELSA